MSSESPIRDTLTESLLLGNIRIILSEFIPCDHNILDSIGNKLMSKSNIRGEFVTMLMDTVPESTTFSSEQQCNSIRVIETEDSEFLACEATIQDPNDVGEDQEEFVGIFINHEGHVVYGMELIEAEGKPVTSENGISMDKLTRILIDLTTDTSLMMNTLLTHHQRRLMDCVYKGVPDNRNKFIGILAESISPTKENPEDYLDGEELQNEIEQILDNLARVHNNPSDNSLFLIGDAGIVVVSKNWKSYESLVMYFSLLRSAEMFIGNLFHRMSLLWDELSSVRALIDKSSDGDVTVITDAQNMLTEASANFTIIKSVSGFLSRGFNIIHDHWRMINTSYESDVLDIFQLDQSFDKLLHRIVDTGLDLGSLASEVEGLQTLLSTQIEQQMRRVYNALRDNAQSTSEVIKANERTGNVLDVIELILSGTIAFDIVMAITGEYITPFALFPTENPIVFFILAIGLWFGIVVFLKKGMDWLESRITKTHLMRIALNAKCDIEALETYLDEYETISIDEEILADHEKVRVLYASTHKTNQGNSAAKISVIYDRRNSMIHDVVIETTAIDFDSIKHDVLKKLKSACIKESSD